MPSYQYQQTHIKSCGASSLLCAAMELGSTEIPATPQWPLWTNEIQLTTNKTCEMAIYSVTSGGGGLPPGPDAGYSMPSNIYEAARPLGRSAVAYVPNSLTGAALSTLYSNDVKRAKMLGMRVESSAPPHPTDNQRLIRVLRVGDDAWYKPATGLHYVMHRPDDSVMDPADGVDYGSLKHLIDHQKSLGMSYVDSGIGLMIY